MINKNGFFDRFLSTRLVPFFLGASIVIVALFSLVSSAPSLHLDSIFPIQKVEIHGNIPHIDRADLQNIVTEQTVKGFFAVDVHGLHERILQLPWVASVSIRRIWPSTLVLMIHEKIAVAHFNKTALISAAGEIYYPHPDTIPENLPNLFGPAHRQSLIYQWYLQMSQVLAQGGFTISQLLVSERGAWQITLKSGVVLELGRDQLLTRLNRFIKLYPQLIANDPRAIRSVDLRYPNGVAVARDDNKEG